MLAASSLGLLMVWQMRSTAMLALAAPIALAVYSGRLSWRRTLLPVLIVVPLAYYLVTVVRGSSLPQLLSRGDILRVQVGDVVAALRERSTDRSVVNWALRDLSYRTAGLEGVAAIVEAQAEGRLDMKLGRVTGAGLLQALPASLRAAEGYQERLKTAPAHYGIFLKGDWVTTILAEQVLDWGPVFLLVSAFALGLVLECIDRGLLALSRVRVLRGLVIIRYAWVFEILVFEWGLADVTLMFVKAIAGYIVVFIVAGFFAMLRSRQRHAEISPTGVSRHESVRETATAGS